MSGLKGKKILITRPKGQCKEFAYKLLNLGAHPIIKPMIEIRPVDDWKYVDNALNGLKDGNYDWVIFTSVNGVKYTLTRMENLNIPKSVLNMVRIGAIGPSTASFIQREGLKVDFIPEEYISESLGEGLEVRGQRVLLLRSKIARNTLRDILIAKGAYVDEVPVYTIKSCTINRNELLDVLKDVDIITFTSSSTVHHFIGNLNDKIYLDGKIIASIGPITSSEIRKYGLSVHVEAEEHTINGLIRALIGYFNKEENHAKDY